MPENENTEETEQTPSEEPAAQAATEPKPTDGKPKPPWGSDEEFDPEKAWKLIQNLRSEKEQLKPLADKAKELEDAQKTEQERLTEKLTASEKRAVEAELKAARLEVATEKGLPRTSVKFLTGTTPEELAESADELLALLAPEDPGDPDPRKRPKERLRPGSTPVKEPDENPAALAERLWQEQRI